MGALLPLCAARPGRQRRAPFALPAPSPTMADQAAFQAAPDCDGPRVTEKQPEHTPLMKQKGCSGIICSKSLLQQGFLQ